MSGVKMGLPYALLAALMVGCGGGGGSATVPPVDDVVDVVDSGENAEEFPLLGSRHAKSEWNLYCDGKPDSAELPPDPRTLVVPGTNVGKAVYFNAFWESCHENVPEEYNPTLETCGDWRASVEFGERTIIDILPSISATVSAEEFGSAWQAWGLTERPENYDQMYTLRYGMNAAPYDNPYPLPGEDPNLTNGGSGQLPQGFRQTKDADGNYTGQIGSTACLLCHGGTIGDPYAGDDVFSLKNLGLGNNNVDLVMQGIDSGVPINVLSLGTDQRGQNNATGGTAVLMGLLDWDTLEINPNPAKLAVLTADSTQATGAQQDAPAWWGDSFKTRKMFDGGPAMDAQRLALAAGGDFSYEFMETHDDKVMMWLTSLESPKYPGEIDIALAEQGAILFHVKDLRAAPGNEGKLPTEGNGSCASCHGVTSPRFANDPAFLDDPALEGIAAYRVPLDVIGTDPAHFDHVGEAMADAWDSSFWSYTDGQDKWVDPKDKDPALEMADDGFPKDMRPEGVCKWNRTPGYMAPPLYGVWATSPYLHNGSVPTLEAVLDSSKRPQIWRRQLQTIGPVTGYDQRLDVAYDYDSVGWKHDVLSCGEIPGNTLFNCNPVDDEGPSYIQTVMAMANSALMWAPFAPVNDPTPGAEDKRFIMDTRKFGNSNSGHDFTDALTGREREAIIEYLKTL
ncbi:hypothetical protein HCU74_02350 [Spongiibacter sp. KMU-166]|uniref:Cytochrome c domain-containing protein n=1 Tax=Spongiibacter thalassae TaxID=2721624 RepID=A0ABX1GCL8_9GAMM|nr:hypothetical protein [Spongiibacter thalassae]NKI16252.1 hypothetical protein [Spongiibacter thalassae]